jgi:hypothetical protein
MRLLNAALLASLPRLARARVLQVWNFGRIMLMGARHRIDGAIGWLYQFQRFENRRVGACMITGCPHESAGFFEIACLSN